MPSSLLEVPPGGARIKPEPPTLYITFPGQASCHFCVCVCVHVPRFKSFLMVKLNQDKAKKFSLDVLNFLFPGLYLNCIYVFAIKNVDQKNCQFTGFTTLVPRAFTYSNFSFPLPVFFPFFSFPSLLSSTYSNHSSSQNNLCCSITDLHPAVLLGFPASSNVLLLFISGLFL